MISLEPGCQASSHPTAPDVIFRNKGQYPSPRGVILQALAESYATLWSYSIEVRALIGSLIVIPLTWRCLECANFSAQALSGSKMANGQGRRDQHAEWTFLARVHASSVHTPA